MFDGIQIPYKKFKLQLQEIKTGESKEITVQINQKLEVVKLLAKHLFDDSEFELKDIIEIPTIVQIAVEPYCTN